MLYPTFEIIKMQYSWGPAFMVDEDVAYYVPLKTITADQYKEITGKNYEEK